MVCCVVISGAARIRAERVSEAYGGTEPLPPMDAGFGMSLRDLFNSVRVLLTNPTFMFLNMAGASEGESLPFIPGYPRHRENRENGQKDSLSGKTQEISIFFPEVG